MTGYKKLKVERRAAAIITASSASTATITTINPQIQTENKATKKIFRKLLPVKKKKVTVNQNSTENIKGNENTSENRKARTTKRLQF